LGNGFINCSPVKSYPFAQPEFETFSEYAAARFDLKPAMVSKFMNAARTIGVLQDNGFQRLPENEGQTGGCGLR
jgi:hypothetical protein